MKIPKYHELMWPTLKAVEALGGSGTNQEIYEKTVETEGFSEDLQNYYDSKSKNATKPKLEYNVSWARWYLGKYGALENSARGVWSITELGESLSEEEIKGIPRKVRLMSAKSAKATDLDDNADEPEEEQKWKQELLNELLEISPVAFERLCKRVLRESGFIKVEVTSPTADGGIDGMGILRVNLLSFHVVFQAKRYKGSVGAPDIQKFKGAFMGRGDKGLFITTGTFTKQARDEASRDGSAPIDLIDGDELCELMKDLGLGMRKDMIEKITIDKEWFKGI